jgi:methionyl-tRNA formyltransferase
VRVAFAGTPEFARVALQAIGEAGHDVVLVLTQPDRPAGRGLKLQATPVKALALDRGWPVVQPRGLRLDGRWPDDASAARAALQAAAPDVMVVAAYGLILPRWVLELPRLGCLNIHGSLLPRWRGAAPIHRAIEAGDTVTGITIMQMDEGLDTGPMLLEAAEPIRAEDSTGTLHDRLAALGARLVVEALRQSRQGPLAGRPQPPAGATYAHKVEKAESAVDWRQPAQAIARRVRAFDPFPGMHFQRAGHVVKLWRAAAVGPLGAGAAPGTVLEAAGERLVVACGDGALELQQLQPAGGRRLEVGEFLRGHALAVGEVLGGA